MVRVPPLLLAAFVALAGACGRSAEPRGNGLNVLLVSLDSTRRDALSTYGHRPGRAPERATSPHLDALAAQGVTMLDASSTSSWTLPAHLSLLTGEPPLVHAVDLDFLRLEAGIPTLAELLAARGYRTAGLYSGPYLEPRYGFGRGFERYEACYGDELVAASERSARLRRELEGARTAHDTERTRDLTAESAEAEEVETRASHRDRSSAKVIDAALEELEEAARGERPFFLFAHLFDPHFDYAPPAPYDGLFDPEYDGGYDGAGWLDDPRVSVPDDALPSGRRRTLSERDLEHALALYEGEIAWTDAQIGRLLARLDELGLAERTLVVVTADHGDEFFEHGGIGHRRTLFQEVLAVPLLLRLPGRLTPKRVSDAVSIADVLPTLLELLDLQPPSGLASKSFLARIEGSTPGEEPRGITARLVSQSWRELDVRGAEPVRCKEVRVLESFRLGSIEIARERSWPEAELASTRALVEPVREDERRRERLEWIDLARSPGEGDAAWSSDFTDSRALEALRAFHARYGELLSLRREAHTRGNGEERAPAALRGLGYLGDEEPGAAQGTSELFRLPPPGEHVLFAAH